MNEHDYLTVQQAARALGVTDNAVRIAVLEGRLPHRLIFGRKVIAVADLETYRRRTRPAGVKPRGRPRKQEAAS